MLRDDQHKQKASHNEAFAESLTAADATSETWAVVAIFYSALHYVQSVLVKGGGDCSDHKTRSKEVSRDPILKYIAPNYDHLFTLSHLARYRVLTLTAKDLVSAKADLAAIKDQIVKAQSK